MGRRHLQVLVFTSGACVMAVEMTGLRLLAPYFGTSLMVTTVLIGSLMAFLSLGYWLGGRRGDKHPSLPALCKATGLASLGVLAIPFVGQPVLRTAAAALRPLVMGAEIDDPNIAIATLAGGFLGTLLLFALPVTLMGMVSPWAIRLAVDDLESSGRAAGRLYALSTFGSIVGTFLPALVFIPTLGVRDSFVVEGAALLAVSALGFLPAKAAPGPPLGALALMLVPSGLVRPMDGLVWEEESLYHFIQVVREPFGKCPDALFLYLNEGVGIHSVKCPNPEFETGGEWTYMAAAPLWLDEPGSVERALIVGLAGGTSARQLLRAFPEARVDGVEIDPAVVEVGRKWFDLSDERVRPIVMDGRVYLQNASTTYDVVLMDAYRQPYIPFHLVTREFFELVAEHLAADGVLAVNVATVRGVSRDLAAMIYRTLREVFPTVVLVDATQANDILYATTMKKDDFIAARHVEAGVGGVALNRIRKSYRKKVLGEVEGWQDAQVLTDDRAPVELAWDVMMLQYAVD